VRNMDKIVPILMPSLTLGDEPKDLYRPKLGSAPTSASYGI